jgi:hypothetical protein
VPDIVAVECGVRGLADQHLHKLLHFAYVGLHAPYHSLPAPQTRQMHPFLPADAAARRREDTTKILFETTNCDKVRLHLQGEIKGPASWPSKQ